MFGYIIFESVFSNLNLFTKKKILKNIFEFNNILDYNIYYYNNKIIFQFFDGVSFFQFIFILDSCYNEKGECFYKEMVVGNRMIANKKIFIDDFVFSDNLFEDYISIFIKILLEKDEYTIYLLMSHLL